MEGSRKRVQMLPQAVTENDPPSLLTNQFDLRFPITVIKFRATQHQRFQHRINYFHGVTPMGESLQSISQSKGGNCHEVKYEPQRDLAGESPSLSHEDKEVHDNSTRSKDITEVDTQSTFSDEGARPPLPPRPRNPELLQSRGTLGGSTRLSRPNLQAVATTAISCTDVHTQSFQDGHRERFVGPTESTSFGKSLRGVGSLRRFKGWTSGENDDSASVRSSAPTVGGGGGGEVESLLGEVLESSRETPSWKLLSARAEASDPFDLVTYEEDPALKNFELEFDELPELDAQGNNEGLDQSLQNLLCFSLSATQSISCRCGRPNENIFSFCPPRESRFTIGMVTTI